MNFIEQIKWLDLKIKLIYLYFLVYDETLQYLDSENEGWIYDLRSKALVVPMDMEVVLLQYEEKKKRLFYLEEALGHCIILKGSLIRSGTLGHLNEKNITMLIKKNNQVIRLIEKMLNDKCM
ncbi:MAG: hypothetical protein LBI72_05395 [Flavobacteriaceae bacterium]|jgi:hypothetical protein|nr:hypothetical protein [Flavobacteriaceae bacterium]